MIRADITGTRPVGPIEPARPAAPASDARQEAFDRFNQAAVGKLFQSQVLSRLSDGSFAVKVSDATVRMNLPDGAQVGDTLDLTLVATQPRPTFLLGAPTGRATASLSTAGRLIDTLLQTAQKEGAPTALVGKTPLVPSPAASTTQVATALKDTLTFSGLFYESHVGQWASGDRSLHDLMREPQAKHSALLTNAALRPGADNTGARSADAATEPGEHNSNVRAGPQAARPSTELTNVREGPGTARPSTELTRAASPSTGISPETEPSTDPKSNGSIPSTVAAPASEAGTAARTEILNSESVRMISLQLDTLEQRHVAWQGELWPGQPMEWEVTEEAPDRKADDPEKSWQSVVRFELPALGAVSAAIRLTGDRLQVQVRTADETAASLLRAHGAELASALDAAGSPLDLLTVKRDESV